MSLEDAMKYVTAGRQEHRRHERTQYAALVAKRATASTDELTRIGNLAEQLGYSDERVRADLAIVSKRRRVGLAVSPELKPEEGLPECVYLTAIIGGVSCGPDFDANQYDFVRATSQPEEEWAELLAIARAIGPRGAVGRFNDVKTTEILVEAGLPLGAAVDAARRQTVTRVRALILEERVGVRMGKRAGGGLVKFLAHRCQVSLIPNFYPSPKPAGPAPIRTASPLPATTTPAPM